MSRTTIPRRMFVLWVGAALTGMCRAFAAKRNIAPWAGWDKYAAVPAMEITRPTRILICSGMCAPSKNGRSVMPIADVSGQMTAAIDTVEELLRASGYTWVHVTELNIYALDVDAVMGCGVIVERLKSVGAAIPGTLIGVTALGMPDLAIELEVTAMM